MPLKEIKKICCQFEWWNRDLILLKINPVRGWVNSSYNSINSAFKNIYFHFRHVPKLSIGFNTGTKIVIRLNRMNNKMEQHHALLDTCCLWIRLINFLISENYANSFHSGNISTHRYQCRWAILARYVSFIDVWVGKLCWGIGYQSVEAPKQPHHEHASPVAELDYSAPIVSLLHLLLPSNFISIPSTLRAIWYPWLVMVLNEDYSNTLDGSLPRSKQDCLTPVIVAYMYTISLCVIGR